jgi:HEAT repeat protein
VRVRSEAARRLQFGDTAAVPLLRDALADPDPIVVAEAIDSLKFLGDPSVIPDLAPLLDHADSQVRREAEAAIRRLE